MDLTDYLKLFAYLGLLAFIGVFAWGMSLIFRPIEGTDSENKKDLKKEEEKT